MQDEEGYVLYVRKNALQVLIPKYGLECTLYLSERGATSGMFEYSEEVSAELVYLHFSHYFSVCVFRTKPRNVGTSSSTLLTQLLYV